MKTLLIVILGILFIRPAPAIAPIIVPLKPYTDILLEAIIYVESRGNPKAYNAKEDAAGQLQIRPIMVREANRICGYERFSLKDRWDPQRSIEMWYVVQNYHNPSYSPVIACSVWNAGNKKKQVPVYLRKVAYQIFLNS